MYNDLTFFPPVDLVVGLVKGSGTTQTDMIKEVCNRIHLHVNKQFDHK